MVLGIKLITLYLAWQLLHYNGGWGGGDNPNKACFGRRTQFFQEFGNFIRNQETLQISWETWYISGTWRKKIGPSSTTFLKSGKKSPRYSKFAGWLSVSHCWTQTAFVRTVTPHTTAISLDRWVELVHLLFQLTLHDISLRNFISGINLHMNISNKSKIPLRLLSDLSWENKTLSSRSISFHPKTCHISF